MTWDRGRLRCVASPLSASGYMLEDSTGRRVADAVDIDVCHEIAEAVDAGCPMCDGLGCDDCDCESECDDATDDRDAEWKRAVEYLTEFVKKFASVGVQDAKEALEDFQSKVPK